MGGDALHGLLFMALATYPFDRTGLGICAGLAPPFAGKNLSDHFIGF